MDANLKHRRDIFTLRIELGNDAMQDHLDVASALERVSHKLVATPETEGAITDLNGNTVGHWHWDFTEVTE